MSKYSAATGSVRVDLLGGTLDLNPINVILPNVVTLNLATSLKAKVQIKEVDFDGVMIESLDYKTVSKFNSKDITPENLANGFFEHLTFVVHILALLGLKKNISMTLESGSPPGAGLGGSSAMGVTCYKAICEYLNLPFDRKEAILKVNSLEARILDCGPAGYQDYYPALFGGVLGLIPGPGTIEVDQLYTDELKKVLESNITLAYSGETRNSGINNWEVYKAFFNKDAAVRKGMTEIARLSHKAYLSVKAKNYSELVALIAAEGEERRKLFPGIMTPNMNSLYSDLKSHSNHLGMKICGAGGGGCFLITHRDGDQELINSLLRKYNMTKLEFQVEKPL